MRDIPIKQDNVGDTLPAGDFNASQSELENAVTDTGQTLDPAGGPNTDLNMLGKALAIYAQGAEYYQDSGSANTYVLSRTTSLRNPTAYYDGMTVMYVAGNTNTGGSTINVAGFGAKSLTFQDGTALFAGAITSGGYVRATYRLSVDRFETIGSLVITSSQVQIAGKTFVDTSSTEQTKSGKLNLSDALTVLDDVLIGSTGSNDNAYSRLQVVGPGAGSSIYVEVSDFKGAGRETLYIGIDASGERVIRTGGPGGTGDAVINIECSSVEMNGVRQPFRIMLAIGTWDMDATASVNVAHGFGTDANQIVQAGGMIFSDNGPLVSDHIPITPGPNTGSAPDVYVAGIDGTNITLTRRTGGVCDNLSYNSTGINRGYVVVDYDPTL